MNDDIYVGKMQRPYKYFVHRPVKVYKRGCTDFCDFFVASHINKRWGDRRKK